MYLSRPYNKCSHMDPLASRPSFPVTEQSVNKDPAAQNPAAQIMFLKQGERSVEEYVMDFNTLARQTTMSDLCLMIFFRGRLSEPFGSVMPLHQPHWTITQYLNIALQISSSSLTVGVAGKQRDIAVTPAVQPARVMAAVPERAHKMAATVEPVHKMAATAVPVHKMAAAPARAHKMAATAEPVHKMAAAPARAHKMPATAEPVHKMAVKTELRHVTAAIPELYKVSAVFPESSFQVSQVKAVFPVSSQVTAIFPEPSTVKMAATPEPLHKMAATPEPLHKMAAIPEPVVNTRTPPVVMMAHVLDSPLMTVWAAKMALLHAAAATPESS
ncbi:Mucin-1 [Labeo rohita]|uniref:Mucin-1 n=1 Tax=Labeo rohita TaxID=84645 RepID=A0ABQ8LDC2_LABRO|nr:Mucin-1 [Labeo rohita]